MIYNGVGKNLSGIIKCFSRKVLSTGDIQSYYDYPNSETWSTGQIPPTLTNGKNVENITFDTTKMGYILYFSTVLDFYLTADGVKERLVEPYTFSAIDWNGTEAIPTSWDYVIDNDNGSMLISKDVTSSIGALYTGTITVIGQFSNKIKKVNFNL